MLSFNHCTLTHATHKFQTEATLAVDSDRLHLRTSKIMGVTCYWWGCVVVSGRRATLPAQMHELRTQYGIIRAKDIQFFHINFHLENTRTAGFVPGQTHTCAWGNNWSSSYKWSSEMGWRAPPTWKFGALIMAYMFHCPCLVIEFPFCVCVCVCVCVCKLVGVPK